MNINTSNATSFAGRFTSQKMPEGKHTRKEEKQLIEFAKEADKFMKESTRDSDVIELQFEPFTGMVEIVHKDPNGKKYENIESTCTFTKETLDSLLETIKQHFEKPEEHCKINAQESYNDVVEKMDQEGENSVLKSLRHMQEFGDKLEEEQKQKRQEYLKNRSTWQAIKDKIFGE